MSGNVTNSSPSFHRHLVEEGGEAQSGSNGKEWEVPLTPHFPLSGGESPASLAGRVEEKTQESRKRATPRRDDEKPFDEELEFALRQKLEPMRCVDEARQYSYNRLLEGGHYRLLDHLLKIDTREEIDVRNFIKSFSLSELVHSALETQQAIVDAVTERIPISRARDVCFIVGNRKSGNSTAFCYLCGDRMKLSLDLGIPRFASEERPQLIHGSMDQFHCTFLPNIDEARGVIFVDFPGIDHSYGEFISMGKQHALIRLLEIYQPKILLTHSVDNEARFHSAYESREFFSQLLGEENLGRALLCFSKQMHFFDPAEIEKESIEIFKIKAVCSLDDLEQAEKREQCFEALQSAKRVQFHPNKSYSRLFYTMSETLKFRMSETVKELKAIWKSKEEFEKERQKNGVVSALFSSSHPEVLEFLTLPEIDPEFVNELNHYIESCCSKEIKRLVEVSDSFILGGE